jgi:hypothetical protein
MRHAHVVTVALPALLTLTYCGGAPTKPAAPAKLPAKVIQFYSGQGVIRPGEHVTICYGVEHAETVRIDPYIEQITPSLNRCIEAKPEKTTLYTLTAEGPDGKDEASFTITVDPNARPAVEAAAPTTLIQFFMASSTTALKGRPVTLCYGTKDAASVSLDPKLRAIEPAERSCFSAAFEQTTTLTLTAKNAAGIVDTEKLTITVQ